MIPAEARITHIFGFTIAQLQEILQKVHEHKPEWIENLK